MLPTAATEITTLLGRPGGQTSLFDALTSSLIRPRDQAFRSMAILFTDGRDTLSLLDENTVRAVAARAESSIFVVTVTENSAPVVPHRALFENITETTGGRLVVLGRTDNLSGAFVRALDDYRLSYVLRYAPKAAPLPGWHDLAVRVTRSGRYDLRARSGYFVMDAGK